MLELAQGRGHDDMDADSATSGEPPCEEELLLEGFHKLELPEGFRAEFIEGEIVVSPPPDGSHEGVISALSWQIARNSATRMDFSGNEGLLLKRGAHCTKKYVIPDGLLAPHDLGLFWEADPWMPADGVAMVMEATSGKPDQDRGVKRHCYAKALIPLYLLVDRSEQSVTLFSEPNEAVEDYRADVRVSFGKPVELPDPFAFTLDTAEFAEVGH